MLSKESFLRNLHVGLPAKERLALEAIGFAFGALEYSYERLRAHALALAECSEEELYDFDISPLFVNGWAIVDHAHLARKLLGTLTPEAILGLYISETEGATQMRNRIHHIHSNLKNLSLGRGDPALFGSMSIHVIGEGHLLRSDGGKAQIKGYRIIVVNAGKPVTMQSTVAEGHREEIRIESPVGRFVIEAFGSKINLSELVFSARRAGEYFDTVVRERVERSVREASIAAGVDPDEEMKKTGLSLVFTAEVQLLDPPA